MIDIDLKPKKPLKKLFNGGMPERSPDLAGQLAGPAAAIPGAGPAISAVLSVGSLSGKATKDDWGIYRSKGAEITDRLLNPLGTISDIFSGNLLDGQDKLKEAKKFAEAKQLSDANIEQEKIGVKIKNAIPSFTAPAYGKKGMKFKKFNPTENKGWAAWPRWAMVPLSNKPRKFKKFSKLVS